MDFLPETKVAGATQPTEVYFEGRGGRKKRRNRDVTYYLLLDTGVDQGHSIGLPQLCEKSWWCLSLISSLPLL